MGNGGGRYATQEHRKIHAPEKVGLMKACI